MSTDNNGIWILVTLKNPFLFSEVKCVAECRYWKELFPFLNYTLLQGSYSTTPPTDLAPTFTTQLSLQEVRPVHDSRCALSYGPVLSLAAVPGFWAEQDVAGISPPRSLISPALNPTLTLLFCRVDDRPPTSQNVWWPTIPSWDTFIYHSGQSRISVLL